EGRWFGIDPARPPRLAGWAMRAPELEARAAAATRAGVPLGGIGGASRRRADGELVSWRFTDPRALVGGGIVPFLIDWGSSPHPAGTAAPGLALAALRAEHPEPEAVRVTL